MPKTKRPKRPVWLNRMRFYYDKYITQEALGNDRPNTHAWEARSADNLSFYRRRNRLPKRK